MSNRFLLQPYRFIGRSRFSAANRFRRRQSPARHCHRSPPTTHRSAAQRLPCTSRAAASTAGNWFFDHQIAVGRRGLGDRAEMDHGVEPPAPAASPSIRPAARRRRAGVWPDCAICRHGRAGSQTTMSPRPASFNAATTFDPIKTGATGHQQHAIPCPDCAEAAFAPLRRGRQLGS